MCTTISCTVFSQSHCLDIRGGLSLQIKACPLTVYHAFCGDVQFSDFPRNESPHTPDLRSFKLLLGADGTVGRSVVRSAPNNP